MSLPPVGDAMRMLGEEETACAWGINIPDLDVEVTGLVVLLDVDVDGKVSVDVSHLVLVALRYTDDQVVDVGSDSSEGGDVLARAVVDLNADYVLLGLREVDSQMAQVLRKLACVLPHVRSWSPRRIARSYSVDRDVRTSGTLNGDIPRLDVDLDYSVERTLVYIGLLNKKPFALRSSLSVLRPSSFIAASPSALSTILLLP